MEQWRFRLAWFLITTGKQFTILLWPKWKNKGFWGSTHISSAFVHSLLHRVCNHQGKDTGLGMGQKAPKGGGIQNTLASVPIWENTWVSRDCSGFGNCTCYKSWLEQLPGIHTSGIHSCFLQIFARTNHWTSPYKHRCLVCRTWEHFCKSLVQKDTKFFK